MSANYGVFGFWHVTTEGDVEGRTTTDLGVHHGFIDEIAFALGSKAFYSLKFQRADTPKPTPLPKPVTSVMIQLDQDAYSWDIPSEKRLIAATEIFKHRPVNVLKSDFYATVILEDKKRAAALAKLTLDERILLGL